MMPTLFRLQYWVYQSYRETPPSQVALATGQQQYYIVLGGLEIFSLEPRHYGSVLTFNVFGLVSFNFFATILTSNSFAPHISFPPSIFWVFTF